MQNTEVHSAVICSIVTQIVTRKLEYTQSMSCSKCIHSCRPGSALLCLDPIVHE